MGNEGLRWLRAEAAMGKGGCGPKGLDLGGWGHGWLDLGGWNFVAGLRWLDLGDWTWVGLRCWT